MLYLEITHIYSCTCKAVLCILINYLIEYFCVVSSYKEEPCDEAAHCLFKSDASAREAVLVLDLFLIVGLLWTIKHTNATTLL